MKKVAVDSFINGFILWSLSMLLGSVVLLFTQPNIYVQVSSEVVNLKGENYYSVFIQNSKPEIYNGLYIGLPSDLSIDEIVSSNSISIEKMKLNNTNNKSIFKINNILGDEKFTIFIKTKSSFNPKNIKISSNKSDIKISTIEDITERFKEEYLSLFIYSVIISIIYSVIAYKSENRIKKLNELKMEEIQKVRTESKKEYEDIINVAKQDYNSILAQIEEVQKVAEREKDKIKELNESSELRQNEFLLANEKNLSRIEEVNEELTQLRIDYKKQDILLRSRIREYRKELEFWQNTIRKLMYNAKSSNINPDEIFDTVTKSLKTYQTKCKSIDDFDLEALKAMSELIADKEIE